MTLKLYLHTDSFLLYLYFMFSGPYTPLFVQNRGMLSGILRLGPKSESATFCRLQLRLRLQAKWSTPTDSNSGLDSDSSALLTTTAAA